MVVQYGPVINAYSHLISETSITVITGICDDGFTHINVYTQHNIGIIREIKKVCHYGN